MLSTLPKDKPLGIQILGCEEQYILKSLEVLRRYKFDLLDFNAACPAKKVTRRGEGASLLKDPKKLSQLLKLIVKHSSWPVTLKIRTGWDRNSLNAKETALYAEDAGIQALFIHGRSRMEEYSGEVNYQAIREVKKALKIPVIASGNLFSGPLAEKMYKETGCDALSVARGSLGNPWIFGEISSFLDKGVLSAKPAKDEIIEMVIGHLEENIKFYGERVGVVKFRKFFQWYTRGLRKVRPLREIASRIKTKTAFLELIGKI